jgi:hypothetical protein
MGASREYSLTGSPGYEIPKAYAIQRRMCDRDAAQGVTLPNYKVHGRGADTLLAGGSRSRITGVLAMPPNHEEDRAAKE